MDNKKVFKITQHAVLTQGLPPSSSYSLCRMVSFLSLLFYMETSINSKIQSYYCILFSLTLIPFHIGNPLTQYFGQRVKTQMKCCKMQHFIWVFTLCQDNKICIGEIQMPPEHMQFANVKFCNYFKSRSYLYV